jgi:hypothetical protein
MKAAPAAKKSAEPCLWRSGTEAVRAAYRGQSSSCSGSKAAPATPVKAAPAGKTTSCSGAGAVPATPVKAAPVEKAGGCCASKAAEGVVRN